MIYEEVGRDGAKSQKMVGECFVCNQFADIGEGKTGPSLDDMAALGIGRDPLGVNPGQGRGEQAEMEVVGDGIGGPVLAAGAPDFLFDFFEESEPFRGLKPPTLGVPSENGI
ncbi:hypothetical protein [Acidithiobacillus thiooxidans]|uniref:Uncharacterized protein n=1 Tax=Acidithiobacillus thiooxidans TaxID=930 RepID=A0A1C2J3K3_ACITH|nr:hypothetical protein [Acidithiobacillus thiooxidans]OCX71114.1 hypothetical protein A6M23_12530 [Acidithiobacillus thiooxidans]OCX82817.1 hypothetical protein A6P08_11585 [Acidithiobacillus thiooxidans]